MFFAVYMLAVVFFGAGLVLILVTAIPMNSYHRKLWVEIFSQVLTGLSGSSNSSSCMLIYLFQQACSVSLRCFHCHGVCATGSEYVQYGIINASRLHNVAGWVCLLCGIRTICRKIRRVQCAFLLSSLERELTEAGSGSPKVALP